MFYASPLLPRFENDNQLKAKDMRKDWQKKKIFK